MQPSGNRREGYDVTGLPQKMKKISNKQPNNPP